MSFNQVFNRLMMRMGECDNDQPERCGVREILSSRVFAIRASASSTAGRLLLDELQVMHGSFNQNDHISFAI